MSLSWGICQYEWVCGGGSRSKLRIERGRQGRELKMLDCKGEQAARYCVG
jgi:hypothetical protein